MTHFNATNLIPTDNLGHRTKKVRHFLDNRRVPLDPDDVKVTKGRGACTQLPDYILGEYLLWLTPKTREALLNGVPAEEIAENIKEYW
jgi:hypothetical protein